MLDRLFPAGSLFPVGLFPAGLSLSEVADSFGLMLGFKLPRRMPREVLPPTSNVSVGVRRKLSETDKNMLQLARKHEYVI